jgi:hypothetical protein
MLIACASSMLAFPARRQQAARQHQQRPALQVKRQAGPVLR